MAEALRLDMNEYPDYQVLLKLHIILCHAIVKPWSHCKALHGNHFFPLWQALHLPKFGEIQPLLFGKTLEAEHNTMLYFKK